MTTERMDGAVVIRNAESADLEIAREILQQNFLPTEGLESLLEKCFVIALSPDERSTVGLAAIERYGQYGLLRSVAVLQKWRNQGIARRLTENRIDHAKSIGLEKLYLLTTTASEYFKKFGFEDVERSQVPDAVKSSGEFSRDCPESAAVMSLKL